MHVRCFDTFAARLKLSLTLFRVTFCFIWSHKSLRETKRAPKTGILVHFSLKINTKSPHLVIINSPSYSGFSNIMQNQLTENYFLKAFPANYKDQYMTS